MNALTAALVASDKQVREKLSSCLSGLKVQVLFEDTGLVDPNHALDGLQEARPDVLFIDVSLGLARVEDFLRKVRSSPSAPFVVAYAPAPDPGTVVAAMRAGAGEFLLPPIEENLPATVARVTQARAQQLKPAHSGGKTVGFLAAKGGCGATTIACHVAVALGRLAQSRILLADLDLHSGMVGFFLKTKSRYSIADALGNVHRLDLNFWKALVSNGQPRLEIIQAPVASGAMDRPDPAAVRYVVRFTRSHYDWIFVDLARGLSTTSLAALEELDTTFVVTTLDVSALYQAKHIINTLSQSGFGRERVQVLVNRMPKRQDVTLEEIEKMLGVQPYAVLTNDYVGLFDAYAEGRLLAPGTPLGAQFGRLAAKIAGLPAEKGKSRFSLFG